MRRDSQELTELFDALFLAAENTRLVRGEREPLYLPPGQGAPYAQVVFAHGFFASALHEVSHWCIAGVDRRRQVDFGYWYKPDGRTPGEQQAFEAAEVKPQALEWIFATAAGAPFHFSADNLAGGGSSSAAGWARFQENVVAQIRAYLKDGLPPRAAKFAEALAACYGTGSHWRQIEVYGLGG